MSLPSVYQEGPVCGAIPFIVPIEENVGIVVRPGGTYKIMNNGPYAIVVKANSATGTTLATLSAGGGTTLDLASTTNTLYFVNGSPLEDCPVILQPVFTEVFAGLARSPLSFVLVPTGTAVLNGSFFSVDGRELADADGNVCFRFDFESGDAGVAVALGEKFLQRASPPTPNLLWADCVEFRGTLTGNPIGIMPGSMASNLTNALPGGATPQSISPGQVILKSASGVLQSETSIATYAPPQDMPPSTTITAGNSTSYEVDLSACQFGTVYMQFAQSTPRNVRITAARRTTVLEAEYVLTASVLSFDETFSPPDGDVFTVPIELDRGIYLIEASVPSGAGTATNVIFLVERFY